MLFEEDSKIIICRLFYLQTTVLATILIYQNTKILIKEEKIFRVKPTVPRNENLENPFHDSLLLIRPKIEFLKLK